MGDIQHDAARRLLPVIAQAIKTDRLLTYKSAAASVGRDPRNNARMIAQVCDLLDAAAALAGVPLLALVAVRESNGHINRKAWKRAGTPVGLRDKILLRSKSHRFTDDDIAAIQSALDKLDGCSNRAAWARYYKTGRLKDLFRRLAGSDNSIIPAANDDAIDDLGADSPLPVPVTGMRYARDPNVRSAVLRRAKGLCEFCGEPGFRRFDDRPYLESHHIIALANDGADRTTNVIALCANHHREAHYGRQRKAAERKMIDIVRRAEQRRRISARNP